MAEEEIYKEEPWDPMEGKLIKWSVILGIVLTILLAAIIHMTILAEYS
ncbi:hypothetical protein Asulf_01026 [Archaeoglobus sulfaticallidus PM70-1]|uniref:Uncharacterized protein n=1 Tax=Archaeoglobus sulfaticallidus PM70-1 TaxID=387631 RepID=N0BLG8_9EURY|nr:hypothetical protein [Archaeoglobus sulfaticallidus]AGK61030.1 hypothetical protein Asulf_01026 [Archaeoglobus sulfaticallidus PM70-1]